MWPRLRPQNPKTPNPQNPYYLTKILFNIKEIMKLLNFAVCTTISFCAAANANK